MYGDFEDLETGETFKGGAAGSEDDESDGGEDEDDEDAIERQNEEIDNQLREVSTVSVRFHRSK